MCHQVNQPHAKEHQANSDLDEMAAILLCHNLFTYDVLSTLIWASHCIAKELNSSFTVSVFHFCSLSAHGVVKFSLRSSLGKVYCRWNFLQCKATLGKHHFNDNLRIWNIYIYIQCMYSLGTKIVTYLTVNEWGWVSYEELWRLRRVLSIEAVGRGR